MTKLVMLGPPGAGKGTYANRMAPKLNIPVIAMGDLLRGARNDSEIGETVKKYQDSGELVPDEIVIKVLEKRLNKSDAEKGYILDGFPRTLKQAKALEDITEIDAVINLDVPERILIKRLSSRRICKECGEIYNLLYLKPEKEGICDKCKGELYQRSDDKPEAIKERIKVYKKETEPLIDFYKNKDLLITIKTEKIDIPPKVKVKEIMEKLKQENVI